MNSSPANNPYDLLVIGGGPAGCATALAAHALAPQARILMLESGIFPRHKVCGEFVSAEGVAALRALTPSSGLMTRLLQSAPSIPGTRLFYELAELPAAVAPPGLSITRYALDDCLWRICESNGIESRQQVGVQQIARNGCFSARAGTDTIHAQAVVNAAGRWSNLTARRHTQKPPSHPIPEKWLGLKAHYVEEAPSSSVDLYFFKDGYCGVQPVGENRINVCAVIRASVAASLPQVFALHAGLQQRSRGWRQFIPTVSTAPLLFEQPIPVENDIFNVGDAAGFIDPFVGDGITLALHSGALAAQAIAPFMMGEAELPAATASYARAYEQKLQAVFTRASWVRRFLKLPRPFLAAAAKAMRLPGVTRTLVRATRAS